MAHGPVECIVVEFPGNRVHTQFVPALNELVASGAIRILDMMFIRKDAQGQIRPLELSELNREDAMPFEELEGEIGGLINMEDIQIEAAKLPLDCIAGVFVWEEVWTARITDAVRSAQGHVIAYDRIPPDVLEAAVTASEASGA